MRHFVPLALALLFGSFPRPVAAQDTAAFVTTLGADTLAVERFSRTDSGMTAEVVLRTPRTTRTVYDFAFDDMGMVTRYEAITRLPDGVEPIRRVVSAPEGDSLALRITEDGETTLQRVAREPGALPFIDMVHWPFEEMLVRANGDDATQPLFTERGTFAFEIGTNDAGERTVAHPYRGTMTVETDGDGRLQSLDAGATTRALTVTRVADLDLDALTESFAARDAAGQSFGPLSGRAERWIRVDGATIALDYGQPSRRGRDIFGALVPWGEVWRTGANRATHFTTDRDLVLGAPESGPTLDVPAGAYTLFTIPEPEGGTLIVNRETGQNGTSYDPDQDLGRITMTRFAMDQSAELFAITLAAPGRNGDTELWLRWGHDVFAVPFTVAP